MNQERARRLRRVFAAVAGTVAAVLVFAGPASASNNSFRAQALAAGLSSQQASSLQAEVDREVAKTGGVQTGPDQIALPGGWTLSVAIPGEAHPRQFNGVQTPTDSCPYEYFCIYKYPGYSGSVAAHTQYNLYNCADYRIAWIGDGSWYNNQTPGTQAKIIYDDRPTYTTPGAASSNPNWDWTFVFYVKPC